MISTTYLPVRGAEDAMPPVPARCRVSVSADDFAVRRVDEAGPRSLKAGRGAEGLLNTGIFHAPPTKGWHPGL